MLGGSNSSRVSIDLTDVEICVALFVLNKMILDQTDSITCLLAHKKAVN